MACEIDVTQKTKDEAVGSAELDVNIKRVKKWVEELKAISDCDSLKMKLEISGDELKDLTKDATDEAKKLAEQYLPILKLPGPNPFKIVKWIGKLVTGSITPQLRAYIKYTMQLIQLAQAVTELATVAGELVPKLKQCAIDTIEDEIDNAKGEINKELKNLKRRIEKEISEAICKGVAASGLTDVEIGDILNTIEDVKDAIDNTKDLIESFDNLKDAVSTAVDNTLTSIQQTGDQLQNITGVNFGVDTSSADNFTKSINNGAMTQFESGVTEYMNSTPPVNTVLPVISGTVEWDATITVSTGTWTGTGPITYSYQWYADGTAIEGANSNSLTIPGSLVGKVLKCEVIAENKADIVEVFTAETAAVTSPYTAPTVLSNPSVSGSTIVGQTLVCSQGTWSGTAPIDYKYQWQYAKTATDLVGQTNSTYIITQEDVGRTIRCVVTANNIANSVSANSNVTAIITAS